jgi:hypothetical protein
MSDHSPPVAASLNEIRQLDTNQFLGSQPDIASNLAEQHRRNVATFVERNGRAAAVAMSEFLVRATLAEFDKPQFQESRDGPSDGLGKSHQQ